jgi:hypothetical protein
MVVEFGHGPPLVVIPGIQGRWEYVRPAITALARSFRVFTYTQTEELKGPRFDPATGFDTESDQVATQLD